MKLFAALFFAAFCSASAQTPQVPHKMEFAGITLTIRDDARREIQKEVDALTLSVKHYTTKAERARTYFPIIETIFKEEQVPDDFKFLSLQESSLIADAVSTSNAVGFWQFKDFTAMEMGLRVDNTIDERMSIVASSRAAAKYLKKNNSIFDNWLYTLQSYQMGAGGVMQAVKDTQPGARHMEVTSRTYWYVKRFLAYKIAYEEGTKGKAVTELMPYYTSKRESLKDLAKKVGADETELLSYNKWVRNGAIPDDRQYTVVIPYASGKQNDLILPVNNSKPRITEPHVSSLAAKPILSEKKKINGVMAIQALEGEDSESLAKRAGIDVSRFLKWNDMAFNQKLMAGQFYFLNRKRVRATESYHKTNTGETLWQISQKYGVQLSKLKKYNRIESENLSPGQMLWLSSMKPKSSENAGIMKDVPETGSDSFNWSVNGKQQSEVETTRTVTLQPKQDSVFASAAETVADNPVDSAKTLQGFGNPQLDAAVDSLPPPLKIRIADLQRKEHVVRPKETLYSIAKIYDVGVMDLVRWNNLDLQLGIKIDQVLKLVDTQTVTQPPISTQELLHEVKTSDTLYSIARQYGVTIKELMDWNQKKDFTLAVGEKLKVFQRQ